VLKSRSSSTKTTIQAIIVSNSIQRGRGDMTEA